MEASLTLDKALDLLFQVSRSPVPRGISELGRELGIPKSTVHRLVAALARRGLLERSDRGTYAPGPGLIALGRGALDRDPVIAAGAQIIREDARLLGETLFLAGARAGELVVLDRALGTGFLRASPEVGSVLPSHATAIGKLYLALAPDSLGGIDPSRPLRRFTPETRTDPALLQRELREIRASGIARNREEWIPGLAGVAAAIRLNDRLVAGVAVSGSAARFAFERFSSAAGDAARRIEAALEAMP